MQKNLLIGISVVAACVVVCASYSNVVGVQLAKVSNDRVRNDAIDQIGLLFQTIIDMANNKDIQRVILGSELTGKRFVNSNMNFFIFNHPVLTEKLLKRAYTLGMMLSRTLSKSGIQSLAERYQGSDQAVQKELAVVIDKNTVLKTEMRQLSSFSCSCKNGNATVWHFPIICAILLFLTQFFSWIGNFIPYPLNWMICMPIIILLMYIYSVLQCS
jgi:hypothetical protein